MNSRKKTEGILSLVKTGSKQNTMTSEIKAIVWLNYFEQLPFQDNNFQIVELNSRINHLQTEFLIVLRLKKITRPKLISGKCQGVDGIGAEFYKNLQ
jgi:DNA polymerase III delta subunit